MKIKRFFAVTMREAIAKVRVEQGPDAVILSNKRVAGGIEIITAVDYDETLVQHARGTQAFVRPPRVQQEPAAPPPQSAVPVPRPRVVAVHPQATALSDSALSGIERQVESMRGLLESQLSSLAWNDLTRRQPARARVLHDLIALDVAPDIARRLANEVPALKSTDDLRRIPLALLLRRLPVAADNLLQEGGIVAVVGPTGVGKTTTIAKLAARFALGFGARHVALVSTDSYRIGAREQLLTFARIIGVPMHVAADARELGDVLDSLSPRKLILIDTAGMSRCDLRLAEQLGALARHGERIRILLALAANTELAALDDTVRIFAPLKPKACVLTKVDEAGSLGPALSTVIRYQLPIAYLTDGQRVPQDIHAGSARRIWLVRTAAKLRELSGRVPDEAVLAKHFGKVAAHA
jgi:flagellar biosynthesis protein FlhF